MQHSIVRYFPSDTARGGEGARDIEYGFAPLPLAVDGLSVPFGCCLPLERPLFPVDDKREMNLEKRPAFGVGLPDLGDVCFAALLPFGRAVVDASFGVDSSFVCVAEGPSACAFPFAVALSAAGVGAPSVSAVLSWLGTKVAVEDFADGSGSCQACRGRSVDVVLISEDPRLCARLDVGADAEGRLCSFGLVRSTWLAGTSGVVTDEAAFCDAYTSLEAALRPCDEPDVSDGDGTFCRSPAGAALPGNSLGPRTLPPV